MKEKTVLISQLKGTKFMFMIFIIQIVLNIVFIGTLIYPLFIAIINSIKVGFMFIISVLFTAVISLLETLAVGLTYRGFKKGMKGWAIFAIIYALVMMVGVFVTRDYINVTPLVLIAGFIGLKGKRQHTRIYFSDNEEVDINSNINI